MRDQVEIPRGQWDRITRRNLWLENRVLGLEAGWLWGQIAMLILGGILGWILHGL